MKNILEQFNKSKTEIRLREDEKLGMRTFLENYTEAHPVRGVESGRLHDMKRVVSPYQFLPLFIRQAAMPFILIMLLVGGSVSFAAQGALPGDALYGIKVSFNERIEETVAVSSEAKANVEARFAERRLVEAEKLREKGELNQEVEAQIQARFEAHSARVEERIEKLSESEVLVALDVASRFEAALNAHTNAFARISTESGDVSIAMSADNAPSTMQFKAFAVSDVSTEISVSQSVRIQTDRIANIRSNLEARISGSVSTENKTSAEGKMNAAENKISEVRMFIESKTEAESDARADATFELNHAEEVFADGKAMFEAGMYNDAFILFQRSLLQAESAKIRAEASLKQGVNTNIEANTVHVEARSDSGSRVEVKSSVTSGGTSAESSVDIKVEVNGEVIDIGL